MNTKQTDWNKLKGLCNEVKQHRGLTPQETLKEFYNGIESYWETYRTKFDNTNHSNEENKNGNRTNRKTC